MVSPEQFSVRLAEAVDLVVSAEHLHEKVEELWCLVVLVVSLKQLHQEVEDDRAGSVHFCVLLKSVVSPEKLHQEVEPGSIAVFLTRLL